MTTYTQYQVIEPGTALVPDGWRNIPASCLEPGNSEEEHQATYQVLWWGCPTFVANKIEE